VARFTESLAKLRAESRTIQIEFTLTREEAVFQISREVTGKFLTLRDRDGRLFGLLQFGADDSPVKEGWVLRGEDIYEFSTAGRTITKYPSAKEGAFRYVAGCWHPGVWLLDRDEARKRFDIRLWKQDANYTYFTAKPRGERSSVTEYRFAVTSFPPRAIVQAVVVFPNGDQEVWKITKWAVDAAEGLSAKDFPDPAKPPEGWTAQEWPGWDAFWKQAREKIEQEQKKPVEK
jgi:hypothetical protein